MNPLSIRIVTYTHIHPSLPSHVAVVAFVAVALRCHHAPIQIYPRRILKKVRSQGVENKLGHENTHKFEQCDKNECGAYLQYKKKPKDKAMSKDLIGRRERCVEWITRPSPTASPNQSDDVENYAADAVEGLLGMAAIGGLRTDMLEGNGVEGGVDEDDDEYGW